MCMVIFTLKKKNGVGKEELLDVACGQEEHEARSSKEKRKGFFERYK